MDRRHFITGIAAAAGLAPARAQTRWPDRPLKLIVPFAPGGATDVAGRVLATELSTRLGQPVVVETRAGGGGNAGLEVVAAAPADGYTLLMARRALVTFNPHLYATMRADPRSDLVAVSGAFVTDMILVVSPVLQARTLSEVIALAKARPGELNYGSAGPGSAAHILMELFKSMADVDIRHIPYRGTAPALTDLMGGTLDLMIDSVPSSLGQIRAGSVRPVAVCGGRRNARFPQVPTFSEAGLPEYNAAAWLAVFAPKNTPAPVIARLNEGIREALAKPEAGERAGQAGMDLDYLTAADLAARVRSDSDLWGGVIRRAGIRLD